MYNVAAVQKCISVPNPPVNQQCYFKINIWHKRNPYKVPRTGWMCSTPLVLVKTSTFRMTSSCPINFSTRSCKKKKNSRKPIETFPLGHTGSHGGGFLNFVYVLNLICNCLNPHTLIKFSTVINHLKTTV